MAEVAGKLVNEKLIPLLTDEIKLAKDLRIKLKTAKDQLELIRAYLKDADKQAEIGETRNATKEWVKQMREVSFCIEDAIDEYLFVMDNNKLEVEEKDWCGIVGVVARYLYDFVRGIILRHKISDDLDRISKSLKSLNDTRESCGIKNPESNNSGGSNISISPLRDLQDSRARSIEDDKLVGVEQTKQHLTNWLLEEESRRTIVAVIGEGGLGKTTIVNKVYKEQVEKNYFDHYAFINVSHSLRGKEVLNTLIKQFKIEISETDTNTPEEELRKYLEGRSYLIVFDNVWEEESLWWEHAELALPKDKGRIIITTRHQKVAEICGRDGAIHMYFMKGLGLDDARKLFYREAFTQGCPHEKFEELAEKFVEKCNGVPLAIVAMAGLLSSKKEISEWKSIYGSLNSKLSSDRDLRFVHHVLSESYQDLSHHVKSCLLHFGLFPEGYLINSRRLIYMWIAEGFIENKDGQTQEEVATGYLAELIARSLVDVQPNPEGKYRCRVHDLTHVFVLENCKELYLFLKQENEEFKSSERIRHLSINPSTDDIPMKETATNYGVMRSCFLFNISANDMLASSFELLCSSFKLLVRLDCEDAPLKYLPESVGNLFLLKYLNLRNTEISTIPKFIAKLQNLEFLDVKNTLVCDIPPEINKLIKLRLILVRSRFTRPNCLSGFEVYKGIGNLTALQKLHMNDAGDEDVMKELKNLKQVKTLCISDLLEIHGELLCSSMESMDYLSKLKIQAKNGGRLCLGSLTNPPQDLKYLYLDGHLGELPHWLPRLENLASLCLIRSGLTTDALPLLQNLSNLVQLHLWLSGGTELYIREGWFMHLMILRLYKHKHFWELEDSDHLESAIDRDGQFLETLEIDEGAMPRLQLLFVCPGPKTTVVPARIEQVMFTNEYEMVYHIHTQKAEDEDEHEDE